MSDTGVNLTFDFNDEQLISGIAGTATYNGHLGQVSNQDRIWVYAFNDANLTQFNSGGAARTNPGRYDIVTLDKGSYYLFAFVDVNGNRTPDNGEPFEIYQSKAAPSGDVVAAGPMQTNINFTFGDEHILPLASSTPYRVGQDTSRRLPPIRLQPKRPAGRRLLARGGERVALRLPHREPGRNAVIAVAA